MTFTVFLVFDVSRTVSPDQCVILPAFCDRSKNAFDYEYLGLGDYKKMMLQICNMLEVTFYRPELIRQEGSDHDL